MSRRTHRIGDLIRAELAAVLLRDVSDPRVRLTTVSGVDVSPDLSHAVVQVSVLGDDDAAREDAIAALRGAAGFLRSRLAHNLKLRSMPDLRFELDRGAEHSLRIAEILESLDD